MLLTSLAYAYLEKRFVLVALLGALSLLTRPDALILLGPLILDRLYLAWKDRNSRIGRGEIAAAGIPVFAWGTFAALYFGSPISHSVTAKSMAYRLPGSAAFIRLLQHYATPFLGHLTFGNWWIGVGIILYLSLSLIGALQAWKSNQRTWPILAYPFLYFVAFSLANPLIFRWYLTPPLPFYIFTILIGLGAALTITRNISGAIIRLKNATQEISKGKFDYSPEIHNQDELGELSHSFSEMAKRLKRLEEMYLDTNPLTHLPGGIAIENVLKKRINSDNLFAFCLVDLDNFKAYNDHYGYARGNQVIKNTAQIIEKAVKKHGTDETFYGHIGGDDFVVISSADRFAKICEFIVDRFDKTVDKLYDPKDKKKGFITRKTRKGKVEKFPLMTVSIGVVTNEKRQLKHVVQVGEIAAEVKNYAKSKPGSLYYVDRRKGNS